MRVLILGGDGYLGWPTAMQLSALGHEVTVVDNYLRRNICREMDVRPLFEVPSLDERAAIWKEKSGKDVKVYIGDLMDWSFTAEVFEKPGPKRLSITPSSLPPPIPWPAAGQQP